MQHCNATGKASAAKLYQLACKAVICSPLSSYQSYQVSSKSDLT